MHLYRISKYNPLFRNEKGVFEKDEWTSVSDVSKKYNGRIFTMSEYIDFENKYISFIFDVLDNLNIKNLTICNLEDDNHECMFGNGQQIQLKDITRVIQGCLRELYWCKLESKDFCIRFGYDFYIYVYCNLEHENMEVISSNHSLFLEEFPIIHR